MSAIDALQRRHDRREPPEPEGDFDAWVENEAVFIDELEDLQLNAIMSWLYAGSYAMAEAMLKRAMREAWEKHMAIDRSRFEEDRAEALAESRR